MCFSCLKKSKYLLCKRSINSTFCCITYNTSSATYHPKGPGSCLSKFQNMKPENKERTSLFGRPAERSDQRIKTQKPQTNQRYESNRAWLLLFLFFEHFFLWIIESIPQTCFRQSRCVQTGIFHVAIISIFPGQTFTTVCWNVEINKHGGESTRKYDAAATSASYTVGLLHYLLLFHCTKKTTSSFHLKWKRGPSSVIPTWTDGCLSTPALICCDENMKPMQSVYGKEPGC